MKKKKKKYHDDGHRPHKWPTPGDSSGDVIAWKCAACGKWVSELRYENDNCPINWRKDERFSARRNQSS